MTNEAGPKKRGCLSQGCLVLVIIGLLASLLALVLYTSARRYTRELIATYTEAGPAQLERVQLPEATAVQLRERVEEFRQSLGRAKQSRELTLTADELNAWIARDQQLRDTVFLRIESNQISGEISLPLPDIGPLKLRGRYLNGTALLEAGLTNGEAFVRLNSVQVKGKPLPGQFMGRLRAMNFAPAPNQTNDVSRILQHLESLEIRDGQVILRSKAAE